MKVREVIQMIERDGWHLVRTKGDHRQYKHPSKQGCVTILLNPALFRHSNVSIFSRFFAFIGVGIGIGIDSLLLWRSNGEIKD